MDVPIKIPTDRSFGFTFAVVFGLAGLWFVWKSSPLGLPLLILAAVFALVSVIVPRILHPLNVAWMYFGLLLSTIVNPIVMGIVFFGVFTPMAIFFRLKGRDALRRGFEREAKSYWIDRTPPGPGRNTFTRQF